MRHMFEEVLYCVSGRGATTVWTEGKEKQLIEWQAGSLLALPLNANFQHFNGAFDSKIDAPVRDISVWLDDEKVARTDAQGIFRFENVSTNAHKLRAALDGVPAELVFADLPERTTAVIPYNENVVNFRVVKAGRITGRITYADHPAADVRIVASGDRDTFSENTGNFLMSDLPPGNYELRVDPETVPQFYVSKPEVVHIEVKPGRATDNIQFQLVIPQRPVIEKSLPLEQP